MRVALVDYGSGNLHSAAKGLERAAREGGLAISLQITSRADEVARADQIVLPGVGAFATCCAGLKAVPDLWDTLQDKVKRQATPFLGICVGMQLMADRGLEAEESPGFGWIAGDVKKITPADPDLKIPHMGWNTLEASRAHPLTRNLTLGADGQHVYFVHSYHLAVKRPEDCILITNHGGPFAALVARDTMAGTQFHPEKSQGAGLQFLQNFLMWRP